MVSEGIFGNSAGGFFKQPVQETDLTRDLADSEAAHRLYMAKYGYPQPDRWDSLLYAVQEFAEFVDANYTRKRADHKRNSDRDHSPALELGQCLAMLATALLSDDDEETISEQEANERELVGEAAFNIALALISSGDTSIHRAITHVAALAQLTGVTAPEALHMSQEKARRKWARAEILADAVAEADDLEVQIGGLLPPRLVTTAVQSTKN